jgi:hypothetical protein
MAELDHNKLIADAARAALGPLEFRRKGRSRTWYRDGTWWLAVIEFEPSSFSRGSYLNVSPMWLWNPGGSHLTLDVFGRVEGYTEALDVDQFRAAADQLAATAREQSLAMIEEISSPAGAVKFMESPERAGRISYPDLNGGIAHGLCREWETAERLLNGFVTRAETFESPSPYTPWAQALVSQLGTPGFGEAVSQRIVQRRAELKLEPVPVAFED